MQAQTQLKIVIASGGTIPTLAVANQAQLSATSLLSLDNGTFVLEGMSAVIRAVPSVKLEFVDSSTLSITTNGTQRGKSLTFPSGTIAIEGLVVDLVSKTGVEPVALTGTMSHRPGTGTMTVASTGNPAGDQLQNLDTSRRMALVP